MTYVVMADQLNPKDVLISEPQPGDRDIVESYLRNHNSITRQALPSNATVQVPVYKNRLDVIKFSEYFEKAMYRIVFPIAALSGEGGGILDNSSNLAKEDLFFSFVDFWRQKICRATRPKGQFLLDVNGYGKEGYKYALVPAPVAPRNIIIEEKIMDAAASMNKITTAEYRAWLNSTVVGFRPENNYETKLLDQITSLPAANIPAGADTPITQKVLSGKQDFSSAVADNLKANIKKVGG